ncbi:hypothetical protein H8D85_01595 [bacterium]|nr:hypothetical protein [bacterium]
MRIPHERYVKTLVAGRLEPQEILDRLEKVGLSFPLPGVQAIHQELSDEQPDYFKDKRTSIEVQWLKDWGISEMYGYLFDTYTGDNVEGIKGAFKLLDDPLMFRLITSLAIAKITSEDIELIVNGKYNVEYSHDNIELFLKYFFDIGPLKAAERKALVNSVTDGNLKRYYKIALQGDKDYLLWKLGAAPDKSFDIMLRDMLSDSYYNFKERSRVDPDLAQKWGALAVKLADRVDRIVQEDKDSENIFEAIEFKLKGSTENGESTEILHIDDIEENNE